MIDHHDLWQRLCSWFRASQHRDSSSSHGPDEAIDLTKTNVRQLVSFLHGPLDGYQELVQVEDARWVSVVSVPISRATFWLLEGRPSKSTCAPTSLAIYELRSTGRVWKYHFCRQIKPDAENAESARHTDHYGH